MPATQLKKVRGLMGVSKPQALLLQTNLGIHTFFLRFRIDILVLDNENTVRVLAKRFRQWNIFVWNPRFGTVIELPEGTIESSNTEVGDVLQFR